MTVPATQQAPGPDGETTRLASGLTGEQAHTLCEPEPVHERSEPDPGEPEPGERREPEAHEPDGEPEPGEEPTRTRALAIPDLRPYADPKAVVGLARQGVKASRKPAASLGRHALAGIAAVARDFWTGNRTLLALLIGWLTGTYGTKGSIPARLGGAVLAILATAHTIAGHGPPAVAAVLWLWFQAAAMTGRGLFDRFLGKAKTKQPQPPAKAGEKTPEKGPANPRKGLARWLRKPSQQPPADTPAETADQAPAEAPLTALIRELIGDDNGVHLSVLRPAMRERLPGLAEADDKRLREVLVAAGYNPSRTFRARGVAGRSGVHRSELPPLPSPGSRQEDSPDHSPPPESGSDLRKSPGAESEAESGRRGRRRLPEGWTEEEYARGRRWKRDPNGGPSAWLLELLEDVE